MTIGAADLTGLRAVKEVTWGVTPSAAEPLTQIRFTGESLSANLETTNPLTVSMFSHTSSASGRALALSMTSLNVPNLFGSLLAIVLFQ